MRDPIPHELRRLVFEEAGYRCEYCQLPESLGALPHQIDHIIAIKHRGSNSRQNLACSCAVCNKNKGADISSIDLVTGLLTYLFNPRTQNWDDHFRWDDAIIIPISPTGRVTEHILQFNQDATVEERAFWMSLDLYFS